MNKKSRQKFKYLENKNILNFSVYNLDGKTLLLPYTLIYLSFRAIFNLAALPI